MSIYIWMLEHIDHPKGLSGPYFFATSGLAEQQAVADIQNHISEFWNLNDEFVFQIALQIDSQVMLGKYSNIIELFETGESLQADPGNDKFPLVIKITPVIMYDHAEEPKVNNVRSD